MDNKENINKKLLKEIDDLKEKNDIKKFLKELLDGEISNKFSYAYKEGYDKIVEKNINK